jgi:hypothetical protein
MLPAVQHDKSTLRQGRIEVRSDIRIPDEEGLHDGTQLLRGNLGIGPKYLLTDASLPCHPHMLPISGS